MISVITPTLNPRLPYMERVFDALKQQTLPKTEWEYLLIDNGSEPPLEGRMDLSWHPQARILQEPKLGLTPARLRGFEEARGDLIIMVDDDCLLNADYLETARDLMEQYPHIGVLGAYIEGEFEKKPEEWMKQFVFTLCVATYLPEPPMELQYAMARRSEGCTAAGAAMILRKNVADTYGALVRNDPFRSSLDRTGKALIGSGDTDIACTAIDLGMATGMSMRLRATHLIPANRVEFDYIRRLLYASNYGTGKLLVHRGWRAPVPYVPPGLAQRVRAFLRRFRTQDPEAACWFAYRKGYQDAVSGQPFDPEYL
jgi:glycosyltransferase involved in cell wall biosynthesis